MTVLSVALELRRYPRLPADELPVARKAGGAGFVELNPPLRAANLRTCRGGGGPRRNRTARFQAKPARQARGLFSWGRKRGNRGPGWVVHFKPPLRSRPCRAP